jgi:predicted DNA-binding transcriptional regulator YafY
LTRGQRAHHPQRCRQATQAWLSRARNTWRRRLGAGTVLPPLPLDDEEAVAVAVGLRTATGGTVTGIEETSLRALAKLEQVLPTPPARAVNALHTHIVAASKGGPSVGGIPGGRRP